MVTIEPFLFERDFSRVMEMTKQMHSESVFKCLEFNANKVGQLFLLADEHNQNPYFFYVALSEGNPVGFMLAQAGEHFVSSDFYAIDLLIWVDHEARRLKAGEMLLDYYLSWCDDLEVKLPMVGQSTGERVGETRAFFEKCGWECVGNNFIKR